MDFCDDLHRVLWHEYGHFCVDILASASNPDYTINDFWVKYNDKAISNHKWAGAVEMVPPIKFKILVADLDKTSFSILSIISGCLFETIFLKEFLDSETKFTECFCNKQSCAGQLDFYSAFSIYSEIRKKYGYDAEFIKFVEIELPNIYYDKIVANKAFMEQLNKLIIMKKEIILQEYEGSKNHDEFYHYFTEEINMLTDLLNNLLKDTSFIEIILEMKESILSKIQN